MSECPVCSLIYRLSYSFKDLCDDCVFHIVDYIDTFNPQILEDAIDYAQEKSLKGKSK